MELENSYRGYSGECTWLCAIAKNLCMDSFRKRRENVELDEETPASVDIEKMMMDKAASSILGLSVFLAPYVICNIPPLQFLKDKRGLTVMMWDTLWVLPYAVKTFGHGGNLPECEDGSKGVF